MKTTSWRPWIMTVICAACTGVVLALYLRDSQALFGGELFAQDKRAQLGRKTPADTNLVFLGITKGAYADVPLELDAEAQKSPPLQTLRKSFPWPRNFWADLIDRLTAAGAKVVVLDLVFAAPGEGDNALAQSMVWNRNRVVIGSNFSDVETDRGMSRTLMTPSASVLPDALETRIAYDDRVGFVNYDPDWDGVVRRARFRTSDAAEFGVPADPGEAGPASYYGSLAARALTKYGRADVVPVDETSRLFRYTALPGEGFRPYPIDEIFRPGTWQKNFGGGAFFRGKLVVVGPAANIFHDDHSTPFKGSRMLGPELHLNVINAVLHRAFLQETSKPTDLMVIFLAGALALLLCFRVRQPVLRLLIIIVITAGYLILSQWLFDHANLVVLVVSPLLVLNLCGVSSLGYDFILEQLARLRLRATMGYYFSPRVLQEVLANPGAMEPREARVTALLTDLRNSTPLAERLGPQGMFQLLNRVFEVQTAAIMGEEGNLEHFLGDQFLSYWGAPQEQPDATDRSLRAALRLIEGMEALRKTFPPEVVELFGYGVALHSGPVLVGNKGSSQRLDYGLVGDTINEAARVEALTKHYGVTLLITREAFDNLTQPPPSRLIDRVIVKGKSVPVELLEVQNPRSAANFAALARDYEAVFKDYAAGHFAFARTEFQKLVEEHHDGASWRMAERCAELAANPPADWDGVWRMESK